MLRSVLLAIDSESVRRVIRRLAWLPLSADATLTILEPRSIDELPSHVSPRFQHIRLASSDVTAPAILEVASATNADLVLVGDPGWFGWRIRTVLGRRPILIVRTAGEGPYARPLVAVGDRRGDEVLEYSRKILSTSGPLEMSAVHAYTRSVEDARRVVSERLARLGSFGQGWTRYVESGRPSSVIPRAARKAHADLVIVGSTYHSLAMRLVLGSASVNVMRDVPCDVLVVPVRSLAIGQRWRQLREAYEQRA